MIKTILGLLGVDDSSGPFCSNMKFTGGGTASADANTLDAYTEGTFVPALGFVGGSTGITYTSRGGTYTRIGDRVFFTLSMILSSKGVDTGNAIISGLPLTVSATANFPASLSFNTVAAGVGDGFVSADLQATTTTIFLHKFSAGSRVRISDADLTDTSTITISGSYKV